MPKATNKMVRPELKTLLAEAAQSLAKLDAERLEELALSCQALNRDGGSDEQELTIQEMREAKQDMTVLAKVLKATRTNAAVMTRLRELHARRMEYSVGHELKAGQTEVSNGLH